MLFDRFDRIRIVNLAHRKDRRREMEQQLAMVGLKGDPRVEFYAAQSPGYPWIFRSSGSHGNFQSQRTILMEAAKVGDSVLILEDDCNFAFPQIAEFQMPAECDVFYGGYYASDPDDLEYSDIIGSHFMGFSARAAKLAADYLWSYLKEDFEPARSIAAPRNLVPRPGIDGAYVWFRRTYPELVTVFADLSYQRPSRTDVGEPKWFDRAPVLRELAGLARRFKRPSGDGAVF